MLSNEDKSLCLQIAREAIAERLGIINTIIPCPEAQIFREKFGMFVTLTNKGKLRGCIGYVIPHKMLYQSIIDLARSAAFSDNRFKKITKEEFEEIHIEISILSPLYEIKEYSEIVVGRDGLLVQHPHGSGLLLPQVATKYNWSVQEFLKETCHKAGLHESYLSDKVMKIYRFEAEIF